MGNDYVIEVKNASKIFRLYDNPVTGPIKDMLFPWKKDKHSKSFYAVKNINMQINRGEVVGIVGANGAGKTTLLKMIAQLLPIDEGSIIVKGKITALLALGVGVHPEFSGRENILYGGMLLGMSKKRVLSKMDEIIEFAEIGEFINHPFRTYSSGMKARLLFAISMSIEPDILIVDEALATGDSYFLAKSRNKIIDLCRSGATILFVSHNLAQIQDLCSRAYFMAEGRLLMDDTAVNVVNKYNQYIFSKQAKKAKIENHNDLIMINGTGEIQVTDVKIHHSGESIREGFYTGEPIDIQIDYKNDLTPKTKVHLFLGFIKSRDGEYIAEFNTINHIVPDNKNIINQPLALNKIGVINIKIQQLLLLNNTYGLWIIFYYGQAVYCEYKNVCNFFVARNNNSIMVGDAYFWHPGQTHSS